LAIQAAELGEKLSFGFEILCAMATTTTTTTTTTTSTTTTTRAPPEAGTPGAAEAGAGAEEEATGGQRKAAAEAEAAAAAAAGGEAWIGFLDALAARGYFRGELEGSPMHCHLSAQAAGAFSAPPRRAAAARLAPGTWLAQRAARVAALLASESELPAAAALPTEAELPPEEDETWMQISESQLEGQMAARAAPGAARGRGEAVVLGEAAQSLHAFVSTLSGPDGAEVPRGCASPSPPLPPLSLRPPSALPPLSLPPPSLLPLLPPPAARCLPERTAHRRGAGARPQ
jgi:hypothetical protein